MVGYSSFVTPIGNVVPQSTGGNYVARFSNTAVFTGNCQTGEYRQYVKGAFTASGTVLTHRLCGSTVLLPNTFLEDGCPPGFSPGIRAYGYRSGPGDSYDLYTPSPRATGCNYQMIDAPGFNNVQTGTRYSIDLSFRGVLIDTSKSGPPLITKDWTVQGQLTITEDAMTAVGPKPCPLDESDRIVGAHRAVNSEDRKTELHIVVARPPGRPPLDPKSFRVEVKDAKGNPIGGAAPKVYEVGDLRSATATIVISLGEKRAPAEAVLIIGKDELSLPVAEN